MSSALATLAATLGKALSPTFFAATLTRYTAGVSSDPADPAAPSATLYSCRALIDTFTLRQRAEASIDADERSVLILASTLAVTPVIDDLITINEGPLAGQSFQLNPIGTDPARAVWECRGRPR